MINIKNMKLLKLLKSFRLTIFIIIALVIVFSLGVVIPQERLLGKGEYLAWKMRQPYLVQILESIGLTDIYNSTFTVILWIIFFLNLFFVMGSRIPLILRKVFKGSVSQEEIFQGSASRLEDISIDNLLDTLLKRGYRVHRWDGRFYAIKNRYSPLMTILFHMSFVVLLAGGLMTFYTSFRAYADVAEGETFTGEYRIIRGPLKGDIPGVTFTVLSVKPSYYKGIVPTGLEVKILINGKERLIEINRPYKRDGLSFLIKKIDVAPLFILKDDKGKEVDGAYVKLNVLQGARDSFEMGDYRFRVYFFTDYDDRFSLTRRRDESVLQAGPLSSGPIKTLEIKKPAFEISVFKASRLLNKEIIKPGEAIRFDNKSLIFADLRYWVRFYVVGERGIIFIVTGSVLLILSLAVRFLFPRKEISGFEDVHGIYIFTRSDFFRLKPPYF